MEPEFINYVLGNGQGRVFESIEAFYYYVEKKKIEFYQNRTDTNNNSDKIVDLTNTSINERALEENVIPMEIFYDDAPTGILCDDDSDKDVYFKRRKILTNDKEKTCKKLKVV